MLRSPDDPNSKLSSRVLTATHRRRPEVTMADAYSFGIEEEYFLVDAHSKLVARDMPKTFLDIAKEATNGQVRGEFLQSQIEVATRPITAPEQLELMPPPQGSRRGRGV